MKYLALLSLLAVHLLFASSASESSEKSTEEVTKEEEIFDMAATAVTEKLKRTRLTASLHEEFVIFQCNIDSEEDSEEDSDPIHSTLRDQGNERSACCDWIVETASKLLHSGNDDGNDDGIDDDDAAASWTASLCARHLAAVPTTTSSQVDEPSPSPSQLATYMFLYPRRMPETANGLFPPPPPPPPLTLTLTNDDDNNGDAVSRSWNRYVWSTEASGTGEWLVDNESRPAISIVQDSVNANNIVDDTETVTTSLASTLSEVGGMHRDFHHVLRFGNVPQECQKIHTASNNSCTFSVWFSLYLPAGVFINTEDAFSSNQHPSMEFQIYTADHGTELIDQEEPAFASPWHVVLVHLQGPVVMDPQQQMHSNTSENGNDTATAMMVIEWSTLLHIRYPSPVKQRDFARMHVLAPQVVDGGFLQSTTDGTADTSTRWKMTALKSYDQDPVVSPTWVAVGREEDYTWILGLTMVAATVGAAVMLRDISRVASWS